MPIVRSIHTWEEINLEIEPDEWNTNFTHCYVEINSTNHERTLHDGMLCVRASESTLRCLTEI